MYHTIKNAIYKEKYNIELFFSNGNSGIVDFEEYIKIGGIFEKFKNIDYFKKFHVDSETICWGENEIDISPETLYEKATGEKMKLFEKHSSII